MTSQLGVIDQCTLDDEPSHAVRYQRERPIPPQRIDACLSRQHRRENGEVGIGGPYADQVGQKRGCVAQGIDVPIYNSSAEQAW